MRSTGTRPSLYHKRTFCEDKEHRGGAQDPGVQPKVPAGEARPPGIAEHSVTTKLELAETLVKLGLFGAEQRV